MIEMLFALHFGKKLFPDIAVGERPSTGVYSQICVYSLHLLAHAV